VHIPRLHPLFLQPRQSTATRNETSRHTEISLLYIFTCTEPPLWFREETFPNE
jgi:hypothetical protein